MSSVFCLLSSVCTVYPEQQAKETDKQQEAYLHICTYTDRKTAKEKEHLKRYRSRDTTA